MFSSYSHLQLHNHQSFSLFSYWIFGLFFNYKFVLESCYFRIIVSLLSQTDLQICFWLLFTNRDVLNNVPVALFNSVTMNEDWSHVMVCVKNRLKWKWLFTEGLPFPDFLSWIKRFVEKFEINSQVRHRYTSVTNIKDRLLMKERLKFQSVPHAINCII